MDESKCTDGDQSMQLLNEKQPDAIRIGGRVFFKPNRLASIDSGIHNMTQCNLGQTTYKESEGGNSTSQYMMTATDKYPEEHERVNTEQSLNMADVDRSTKFINGLFVPNFAKKRIFTRLSIN